MKRHKLAALKAIYAKIPKMVCAGNCDVTCGSLGLSRGEKRHLTQITRKQPKLIGDRCNYLKDNRCQIYADRPAICRLWGVTETMKCDWGCAPERYLSEKEARNILAEISDLFGEERGSFVDNG